MFLRSSLLKLPSRSASTRSWTKGIKRGFFPFKVAFARGVGMNVSSYPFGKRMDVCGFHSEPEKPVILPGPSVPVWYVLSCFF